MMHDQSIQIPPVLQQYVKHVWVMDSTHTDASASFSIFADGCPGVIFYQSDSGLYLNQDKSKLYPVFLYGQTVDPITLSASGHLRMIVVNFHPHVMQPMFKFSAKEITDTCLDLKLVPAVPRINLTEQLWNTVAPEKQVSILFDYLQQVTKQDIAIDKSIQYATAQIIQSNGEVTLKELHRQLNFSERTFERKFEQQVGVSPKLFCKISQFQSSLAQLKNNRYTKLSDIAYENGYADQSHFIRTFKRFTGLTPFDFQKQSAKVQNNFPGIIS